MAQGNMLLGYARGSVGDVTFFRSKGAQKARARNRKPANPKTEKQVIQRAYFADAVRFFKQCNSNFFKFAYEDRKTNESDYNAFMRHNVKRAELIGYNANRAIGYPALGLWEVSAGSLHGAMYDPSVTPEVAFSYDLGASKPAEALGTVGSLSAHLIENAPNIWRAGDIITVLTYECVPGDAQIPDVNPAVNFDLQVRPFQFILDTADTTSLRSINGSNGWGLWVNTSATDGFWLDVALTDPSAPQPADSRMRTNIIGCAVIQSRNVAGGLLVSTADLIWNEKGTQATTETRTEEFRAEVLNDWQAAAPAVLQGALATEFENPFDGATVTGTVTVAQDEGGTNSTDIDITNGAVEIPHSLSFLFEVQQVVKFKSAALAKKVFDETAGTASGDTLKYPDTFSVMYGSAETGLDVCTLRISGDTLTYGIRANIGQTDCYHITDEGSIAVSVAPFENSIAATWQQPIALINRGTSMDNPTEPPITVECKVSPPEYGNIYYFWFKGKEGVSLRQGQLKIVRNGSTASGFGMIGAPFISVDGGYQWEYDSPDSASGNWQVGATAEIQYDGQTIVNIVVVA